MTPNRGMSEECEEQQMSGLSEREAAFGSREVREEAGNTQLTLSIRPHKDAPKGPWSRGEEGRTDSGVMDRGRNWTGVLDLDS